MTKFWQQAQIISNNSRGTELTDILGATTKKTSSNKSGEHIMAWPNQKVRFSCVDNIGLKQLWKLLALDSNASRASKSMKNKNKSNEQHTKKDAFELCSKNAIDVLLTKRQVLLPERMSLQSCLAINALELSAPATTVLLQQQQHQHQQHEPQPKQEQEQEQISCHKPHMWMQLSGHPESIVPTSSGIVRKLVNNHTDYEVHAYEMMSQEKATAHIVPKFHGTVIYNDSGNTYIELQDLLTGFKDPCIMDIKLGTRTFLETDVANQTPRSDLYKKMIDIDAHAPTENEHATQAVTKLRYMVFREKMSSSHAKGFRIEALRLRGRAPIKELKKVRTSEQINQTIAQFLSHGATTINEKEKQQLLNRLNSVRQTVEQSKFFQRHEIVGSSIFIVYDEEHVGAWLIDFAKSRPLPLHAQITHRADWQPGNNEDGLLKGLDELIRAFENVHLTSDGHCMANAYKSNLHHNFIAVRILRLTSCYIST